MSHNAAERNSTPQTDPSCDNSFTLTGYPAFIPYVAFKSMVVRVRRQV